MMMRRSVVGRRLNRVVRKELVRVVGLDKSGGFCALYERGSGVNSGNSWDCPWAVAEVMSAVSDENADPLLVSL